MQDVVVPVAQMDKFVASRSENSSNDDGGALPDSMKRLPPNESRRAAKASPQASDGSDGVGQILIVDDDKQTAHALHVLIKHAGYHPHVYHTGADALEHAARHKPCAAVIDIHLGDLSGLVLAQKLRKIVGDQMPIIMVSGDTSMETLNSLSHVGATYFFSKPMNPATLVKQLREWMP